MKKVCPYPFSSITLDGGKGRFTPCCTSWLTEEFHSLPVGEDVWNGPAAQALRTSVLDQSYRYCKTEYCHKPEVELSRVAPKLISSPITPLNWQSLVNEQTVMPEGPTFLRLNADPRCNLSCPSCRSEKIVKLTPARQAGLELASQQIDKYRSTLQVLKISNGEVFFTPWLRDIIKGLNPGDYPRLKYVYAMSNGLLFNEATYEQLSPGIKYLQALTISMDAGNEATYQKVRGSDWNHLIENLKWISDLRQRKLISYLQINFTVQKNNYESIPDFVTIGQNLAVDNIKFTALFDWPDMKLNYAEHAVHLPTHSNHPQLRAIYEKIAKQEKVWWALPIPDAGATQLPVTSLDI